MFYILQTDGVSFLKGVAASAPSSLDLILVDVADPAPAANQGSSLLVPPPEYVSHDFLRAGGPVKGALRPGGVLAMNTVAESPAHISQLQVRRFPYIPYSMSFRTAFLGL